MVNKHGAGIASDHVILAQNGSKSNGQISSNRQMRSNDRITSNEEMTAKGQILSNEQTSSNEHIDAIGHGGQPSMPASCRRLSRRQLKATAALVTFCTAIALGSVAVVHNKHDGEAGFRFSRRRNGIHAGPDIGSGAGGGGLGIPPAQRPALLSAFPNFARFFGFNPKGNVVCGEFKQKEKLAGDGFNPKGNLAGGDFNPEGNFAGDGFNPRRSLHELDTLPRVGDIVNGKEVVGPPPTLLFMHLWKCAGSSLRHLLREWAALEDQSIAIVVRCTDAVAEGETVCLQDHQLIDQRIQELRIKESHVVAGHFTWGFQNYVQQPYVMFTTLRNPLELFVSGQQYKNRKATRQMSKAVELVSETMANTLQNHRARISAAGVNGNDEGDLVLPQGQGGKVVGFIFRLIEPDVLATKTLNEAAEDAIRNLDTFWMVGVVEQYQGFMAVLQMMMDPAKRHASLWDRYAVGKYNASPNSAEKVLGAIDPDVVHEFNQTLTQQWEVYDHAVGMFEKRCRQTLPTRDLALCDVPAAPSLYTLTDAEKAVLQQQVHHGKRKKHHKFSST